MAYENATATRLLATNCIVCGRALVDAVSVETGIGPECREHFGADVDVTPEAHVAANKLVFQASIAAVKGHIAKVHEYAEQVKALGFTTLAEKMTGRFVNAERQADIVIEQSGEVYTVATPFRRGDKDAFIAAWRAIPGRRFSGGVNVVPVTEKAALWALLRQFFPGRWGKGPQGIFRVPAPAKQHAAQSTPVAA